MQQEWFFCRCCYNRSLVTSSVIEHDGKIGACTGCAERFVRHTCQTSLFSTEWLPLLEAGVSAACPTCGIVMKVGVAIAKQPALPVWLRELGEAAAVCAGIVAGGYIIGRLLDDFNA